MFEKDIFLNKLDDVRSFVEIAMLKDFDIELLSDKYIVNAKSIMGVFSLDLTKPLKVRAHTDSYEQFNKQLEQFEIKSVKKE